MRERGGRLVGFAATHIGPALGYGGSATSAALLTKAWAQRGHRLAICVSNESTGRRLTARDICLGPNVDVQLYHCYWFRRWGFGLGAIPKLLSMCYRAEPVYIHGIATWPNTLAALFCSMLGRRFVVAVRGGLMPDHVRLIMKSKPHKWLYYKLLTFPTLRRAAAIHCTSEPEAEGVRALLGRDARIVIIANGVEVREIEVAPPPRTNGVTMCCLGQIQQEKGINEFIRVWLECRRDQDRLIVAGRGTDSRYFEEFQRLVGQAEGAIDYRGYVDRPGVFDILAESRFLVLPSGLEEGGGMRENFGNVVAEAMAAGRPVVVARGLAWDHLESVGVGFVFDKNEQSVTDALLRAQALGVSAWQTMGLKARQYVEEHLDADRLAKNIWDVLVPNEL